MTWHVIKISVLICYCYKPFKCFKWKSDQVCTLEGTIPTVRERGIKEWGRCQTRRKCLVNYGCWADTVPGWTERGHVGVRTYSCGRTGSACCLTGHSSGARGWSWRHLSWMPFSMQLHSNTTSILVFRGELRDVVRKSKQIFLRNSQNQLQKGQKPYLHEQSLCI